MGLKRLALLIALMTAGCGGADTPADPDASQGTDAATDSTSVTITPSGGGTLTLDDGRFTLEVPPGAVSEEIVISGRVLASNEVPTGFEDPVAGYQLLPAGTQFALPAIATVRRSFNEVGLDDEPDDIPLFVMSLVSSDGTAEEGINGFDEGAQPDETSSQLASYAARSIAVVGRVNHFSDLVVNRFGGFSLRYLPKAVTAKVGERWGPYLGIVNSPTSNRHGTLVAGQWKYCAKPPESLTHGVRAFHGSTDNCSYWSWADRELVFPGEVRSVEAPMIECIEAGAGTFRRFAHVSVRSRQFTMTVDVRIECLPLGQGETPRCDPTTSKKDPVAILEEKITGSSTAGLLCTFFSKAFESETTEHTSESVPEKPLAGDHTEINSRLLSSVTLSLSEVNEAFDVATSPAFPCGDGPNGLTLCANTGTPSPGEFLVAFMVLEEDLPLDDATNLYEYAFVFDSDGITTNNWTGFPAYPNDFFIGSDRWYVAKYTPLFGWSIEVTSADGTTTTAYVSDARIIIKDNVIGLVVPRAEMGVAMPSYRTTTFRHTGDYGINPPHDWNGHVSPPVDQGMAPFSVLPPLLVIP